MLTIEVQAVWGAAITQPNDLKLATWQHEYVVGRVEWLIKSNLLPDLSPKIAVCGKPEHT